jgi:hypothetical protein
MLFIVCSQQLVGGVSIFWSLWHFMYGLCLQSTKKEGIIKLLRTDNPTVRDDFITWKYSLFFLKSAFVQRNPI